MSQELAPLTIACYERKYKHFLEFISPDKPNISNIKKYLFLYKKQSSFSVSKNALLRGLKIDNQSNLSEFVKSLIFLGHREDVLGKGSKSVPFDEIQSVLSLLSTRDDYKGMRDFLIILFMAVVGLRRSEVSDLKMSDVDWDVGTLKVNTKRKKEQIIQLPGFVFEEILRFKYNANHPNKIGSDAPLLQTADRATAGHKLSVNAIYNVFLQYFGHIEGVSCHGLRKSFVTYGIVNSVEFPGLSKYIGHDRLSSTQIYVDQNIVDLSSVRVSESLEFWNQYR